MNSGDDVDLAALRSVSAALAELVRVITPAQHSAATPCSEWDVTALIDHITGGNHFTAAVLAGERAEDAMKVAVARFGGGGPASGQDVRQSLDEQMLAFLRRDVLDRTWDHVVGDASGRQILRMRLHDLIVHSWDLEEALRPGAPVPEALVRWGCDELRRGDSLTAQHLGLADKPAARRADDWTSYLHVFGRAAARGLPRDVTCGSPRPHAP